MKTRPALTPPQSRPQWVRLGALAARAAPLQALVQQPNGRGPLVWEACGITLESHHQRLDAEVTQALCDLARACDLPGQLRAMAAGNVVNPTEGRAALHMALRAGVDGPWGAEIGRVVCEARAHMLEMAQAVYEGRMTGARGEVLTHVLNIGIGGSETGPRLVVEAQGVPEAGPEVVFLSVP
ncbi:MAG: hypothetical protein ACO37H_06760, partial [Burkholderiaceae bacterium]